jgi:MarR family transcriptional regulator for hemolysin
MDARSDDEIRADLSYLFDKASQALAARMGTVLGELGMSVRDYCVLAKASAHELTQGELAELALLDKTTMVVTLDHLEKAGLARRTRRLPIGGCGSCAPRMRATRQSRRPAA